MPRIYEIQNGFRVKIGEVYDTLPNGWRIFISIGAAREVRELFAVCFKNLRLINDRGRKLARNTQIEIDLSNLPEITIPTFYPLYEIDTHFLVMKGGAGSGKSHFTAQKIVYKCLEQDGHHVLVVRNTANTNRKSCFPLIVETIKQFLYDPENPNAWQNVCRVNETEMKIVFANGSTIWFAGLDDSAKLKSIYNVSIIWIEEAAEIDVKDFRMLKTRLRYNKPGLMQMIITFNPTSITSWLKSEFFDDPKPNAYIHESTYHDNPFLPQEYIDEMESFKESDPYYYQVYCLKNAA